MRRGLEVEKVLVPIYLPRRLYSGLRRVKHAFFRPKALPPNIDGERHVEWSFISAEIPEGPGKALEFGCEHGYLSLMAARKGYQVTALDLQPQVFLWRHPSVQFLQGDLLELSLPESEFDLIINCSSVEHVGIAGRYGISADRKEGDIEVMRRLAALLKPTGVLLMTAPCGRDTVMEPWCRVYGSQRLPELLGAYRVEKEFYWVKDAENRWVAAGRDAALNFQPIYDPSNGHGCAYALGCFVLQRR